MLTGVEGDLTEKKPRAIEFEFNIEPASHAPSQINSHVVHRTDASDAADVRTNCFTRPSRRSFTREVYCATIQSLKHWFNQ